ncbi:MAG: MATE family efflux transporter [Clostridia bacterium]|nr:MATE family efflux transporter [Clostridia bacterium]
MHIQLSDHFTYKKLLRFAFPSIIMMIFTSIYGVVDGIFVSNFVGQSQFAAINLIMPFLMVCGAIGFMIGTGGSALVSKTLGEGENERAKSLFSMLIYLTIGLAVIVAIIAIIFLRPIAIFLGAEGDMIDYCVTYGRYILPALPAFMLMNIFQSFLITAEKPKLGLSVTVAAGCTNMVLDALFVAVFNWGLEGAAIATAVSQIVGGVVPFVYFLRPKNSILRLVGFRFDGMALLRTCTNGSSEFVTNISLSVVNMLYNFQLIQLVGESGVSAYGVIMYVAFIFISVFIGFSIAVTPIVGYHYGAGNFDELKNLFKKSLILISVFALALTGLAEVGAYPLSMIFVGYDEALLSMTVHGLMLYSISYLICGFNIFGSAFFTALNDGPVSAAISFLRTLVFQIVTLLAVPALLPDKYKLDGIWLAVVAAEALSLVVTVMFVIIKRKKYKYM